MSKDIHPLLVGCLDFQEESIFEFQLRYSGLGASLHSSICQLAPTIGASVRSFCDKDMPEDGYLIYAGIRDFCVFLDYYMEMIGISDGVSNFEFGSWVENPVASALDHIKIIYLEGSESIESLYPTKIYTLDPLIEQQAACLRCGRNFAFRENAKLEEIAGSFAAEKADDLQKILREASRICFCGISSEVIAIAVSAGFRALSTLHSVSDKSYEEASEFIRRLETLRE
jgi:hypothetical protein